MNNLRNYDFLHFFFKLLSKLNDFLNSVIASEKSRQNLSEYIQFSLQIRFKVNKKKSFASEKMRNSGNYINNYVQAFFEEDFNSMHCTGSIV